MAVFTRGSLLHKTKKCYLEIELVEMKAVKDASKSLSIVIILYEKLKIFV